MVWHSAESSLGPLMIRELQEMRRDETGGDHIAFTEKAFLELC